VTGGAGAWTARAAVLAHWSGMLLAAECMQLMQNRIDLVFQAGNALVEAAIALRADHWRVWGSELRAARAKPATKAPSATASAKAAASETSAGAASTWARTFGWTIAIATRLWPRFGAAIAWPTLGTAIRSFTIATITGSAITGATITGATITGATITGSASFRTALVVAITRRTGFAPWWRAGIAVLLGGRGGFFVARSILGSDWLSAICQHQRGNRCGGEETNRHGWAPW